MHSACFGQYRTSSLRDWCPECRIGEGGEPRPRRCAHGWRDTCFAEEEEGGSCGRRCPHNRWPQVDGCPQCPCQHTEEVRVPVREDEGRTPPQGPTTAGEEVVLAPWQWRLPADVGALTCPGPAHVPAGMLRSVVQHLGTTVVVAGRPHWALGHEGYDDLDATFYTADREGLDQAACALGAAGRETGAPPLAVGTDLNGSQAQALLHALEVAAVRATVVLVAATADGEAEGDDAAALAARVAYVWGTRIAQRATEATHMGGRITVHNQHRPSAARVVALACETGRDRCGRDAPETCYYTGQAAAHAVGVLAQDWAAEETEGAIARALRALRARGVATEWRTAVVRPGRHPGMEPDDVGPYASHRLCVYGARAEEHARDLLRDLRAPEGQAGPRTLAAVWGEQGWREAVILPAPIWGTAGYP